MPQKGETEGRVLTRRDFIRAGTCVAVGSFLGLPLTERVEAREVRRSRVVLVRDREVLDSSQSLRPRVLERMLDQALETLFESPDPLSAWTLVAGPGDRIGIKSNVWAPLPTPPELEAILVSRLKAVGVKAESIAIDDRGVLANPGFQAATVLINVRPLRTHHWAGLGTLIKNYIMFTKAPWEHHDNGCESLGGVWRLPGVAGRTRLNILVMLTPLFHGMGPHHFSRRFTWPYAGLLVSTDAVAADSIGARIIEEKRNLHFQRPSPISPAPHHIVAADTRYGLGNSRSDRIELIRLGWDDAILL